MQRLLRATLGILAVFALVLLVLARVVGDRSIQGETEFPVASLLIRSSSGKMSKLTVEVAETSEQLTRGLMYRTRLEAGHGMLFKFDHLQIIRMWMKNTPLPLDMIFLNDAGVVTSIKPNNVPLSERIITSQQPSQYVLEFNGGEARRLEIKPGDRVAGSAFGDTGLE